MRPWVMGVAMLACTPPQEEARSAVDDSTERPPEAASWIPSHTDPRVTTGIVRVGRAKPLRAVFERAANEADNETLADLFRSQAAGGFGSGFVVVRHQQGTDHVFVVTNRHVIDGADGLATVSFFAGDEHPCGTVYIHPTQDLAVLACRGLLVEGGLVPGDRPHDLDVIIAAGYPSLGGTPSYQITQGRVSNAALQFKLFGYEYGLLQHTAPIDPGSSGGPLLDPSGRLVGVNVAIIRGRQALSLAIPPSAVTEAVDEAITTQTDQQRAGWLRGKLRETCKRLTNDLSVEHVGGEELLLVSDDLIAAEGLQSLDFVLSTSSKEEAKAYARIFITEPLIALRWATLQRFYLTARAAGIEGSSKCVANAEQLADTGPRTPVHLSLRGTKGPLEMTLVFKQGWWRIVEASLMDKRGGDTADFDAKK